MNNDEYLIQIVGKSPIEAKLDNTKEYSVAFKRLYSDDVNIKDLGDGGYKYTYKFKNLDELTVISGDTFIKGKARKGSQSQVVYNELYKLWENHYAGDKTFKDFEHFRAVEMMVIIEKIKERNYKKI